MISDNDIKNWMNEYYFDTTLHALEQQILSILKLRQEEYPSDHHNLAWVEYSDFILERRTEESKAKWKR